MNNLEKLAALTALKKAVLRELDNVRPLADDQLHEAYREQGVEKLALLLNGERVGEFLVTYSHEKFEIVDEDEFGAWAVPEHRAEWNRSIRPEMTDSVIKALQDFSPEVLAEVVTQTCRPLPGWDSDLKCVNGVVVTDDGEIVPGVRFVPKKISSNTQVRDCFPEVVLPKIVKMGGADALLLEGE